MMSYVRQVALRFVVSAAEFVMAMNPRIQEDEALALACRVAGWAEISDHLPRRLSELQTKIAAEDMEWNPWYERVLSDEIKKAIKPQGEWNESIVTAEGNKITYKINGEIMTELTDNSPKARKDGVIGIQMHGGHTMTIQFKDVRIKLLP